MEAPRRIRTTRQALLVDELLAASKEFRTAQDVYAQLRGAGARIGQTTVHRHLQLLADQGQVDVIPGNPGRARFVGTALSPARGREV